MAQSTVLSAGRAMLVLARARATGTLEAESGERLARLAFVEGVVRGVRVTPESGDLLGDALLKDGAVDLATLARAGVSRLPIGAWLVRTGAIGEATLAHALRRQLRRRVRAVLGWPDVRVRFVAGAPGEDIPRVDEPPGIVDLVLDAVRVAPIATTGLTDDLEVTELGAAVLASATLYPDEAAMVQSLRRGVPLTAAWHATGRSQRALRMAAALRGLGVLAASQREEATLLARKKAEVRRGVSPTHLLDAAPGETRRALRKLVGALHPDRFSAHEALRRAAADVVVALVEAESRLR